MHRGVVQEQLGKKRGTTWVVKWDGFRKSAVHVGKDLSTVRLDPPDRPSDPPPKPPEADGAPPHPKGGASKANDVIQATWGDSEDEDSSNDGDDREGGGRRDGGEGAHNSTVASTVPVNHDAYGTLLSCGGCEHGLSGQWVHSDVRLFPYVTGEPPYIMTGCTSK